MVWSAPLPHILLGLTNVSQLIFLFVFSFAVNRSLNVMTPKDSSITDVGNNELSEMDVKKLNFAYYCQGTTKVGALFNEI